MKTLSIRQPWAELIMQGRKTIEIRTWPTKHRGKLAVHVSQTIDRKACQMYGFDPKQLSTGVIIGTVEVVTMLQFDVEQWQTLQPQHLKLGDYQEKYIGWQLANARRLPNPIPQKGGRRLFETEFVVGTSSASQEGVKAPTTSVGSRRFNASKAGAFQPDELVVGTSSASKEGAETPITNQPTAGERYKLDWEKLYDPDKPFELRVIPHRTGDSYNLAVYQWQVDPTSSDETVYRPTLLIELNGSPLQVVADDIMRTIREAGYKTTDISTKRRLPFRLSEELGLRLGLLFITLKPLSRVDRIEAIAHGIQAMPSEEAYYWFSKCMATANAQRALRVLLSGS